MSTREERENIVVGYGINQKGACCRSGYLCSFDHQFKTLEEAEKFEEEMKEMGYGDTLWGIVEVTLQDELDIWNREQLEEFEEHNSFDGVLEFAGRTTKYNLTGFEYIDIKEIMKEDEDFTLKTKEGRTITFIDGKIEID